MIILIVFLAYLLGSLPFSVWLGNLIAGVDVRQYGDKNPGATNALKAGGWKVGLLVLLLDTLKGALPVAIAHHALGLSDVAMYLVALAPSIGHAYSPFLNWRGGKALAVSLGVWIGLSGFQIPLVSLTLLLILYGLLATDAWSVVLMAAGVLLFILLLTPQALWLSVCLSQLLLIIWKHRDGLRSRPVLRRPILAGLYKSK